MKYPYLLVYDGKHGNSYFHITCEEDVTKACLFLRETYAQYFDPGFEEDYYNSRKKQLEKLKTEFNLLPPEAGESRKNLEKKIKENESNLRLHEADKRMQEAFDSKDPARVTRFILSWRGEYSTVSREDYTAT